MKIYKYIFIFVLFLNKISLNYCISLDIKVVPFSNRYHNLANNMIYKLRNLSPEVKDIFGSMFKLNYYYSNFYIGDSMEKQGFILDTGSSITTSSCSLCKKCGNHIYPPYHINSKRKIISCEDMKCKMMQSKCEKSKCSFKINYAEGSSLKGIYINQKFNFNNKNLSSNIEIPIGCTLSENHLFYKQEVNGIMGLSNNEYNFVNILYKLGRINKNIFSLCFAQLGGVFNIGEINHDIHKTNITYIPILTEKNKYYKININYIYINDKKLEAYSEEDNIFILDSGSTISYFNNKLFDEITNKIFYECKAFNKSGACGDYKYDSILGNCFYFNNTFELNESIYNYWPIISFYLGNYIYKWYPYNYYFNITSDNKIGACMGFNKVNKKRNTLGGSWMIGHDIIFDNQNNIIGIAEADCFQNKNLNKTNGLEFIDINKKYNNKNKIHNILITILVMFIDIIILVLLICIIYKKRKINIKKMEKIIIIKDIIANNEIN